MKKKEIIFYESNSFPSPGPEILELKADNKGSIIEEGVMQGIESELTETKIKNFWKKMDELNVWNWDKNYSFGRICDGHMWKLHLRNKEGKVKLSKGHSEYPYNFKKVINALNNLFDSSLRLITLIIKISPISILCFGGIGDIPQPSLLMLFIYVILLTGVQLKNDVIIILRKNIKKKLFFFIKKIFTKIRK